ncbi:MAG TPA: hypothetical protein VMI11_13455 [Actinomycetes bacterium]|nr:hypothetical protein [Actinomycetes bacterium]
MDDLELPFGYAFGLDESFTGKRWLESTSYRPNTRLIEYAVLRHEDGTGWVQIATAFHRERFPTGPHGGLGEITSLHSFTMGAGAAMDFLGLPHDELDKMREQERRVRSGEEPESASGWHTRSFVIDGCRREFLYMDLAPDVWASTVEFGSMYVGLSGGGIKASDHEIQRVELSGYRTYGSRRIGIRVSSLTRLWKRGTSTG